jgi:hypothetical protein
MANGVVAARLLDPPSTVSPTEPNLGEMVAGAVVTLCAAVQEYAQAGEVAREIKLAGAEKIARLARLQLDHAGGDQDFIAAARRAGKAALRQALNGSSAQHEKVLDFYLDETFDLVAHIVRDERIFRSAMAN